MAKETERRNAMRNVAIQWGPSTMSTSIQTEFLTQPVSGQAEIILLFFDSANNCLLSAALDDTAYCSGR